MSSPQEALVELADRHQLEAADLRDIGEAWAEANTLLTPADLANGLAAIVKMIVDAVGETPKSFPTEHQPTAELVVERSIEFIFARLQQAGQLPS